MKHKLTMRQACGYASEVCPPKLRGYLTGWLNVCWVLGILFGTGKAYSTGTLPRLIHYRNRKRYSEDHFDLGLQSRLLDPVSSGQSL